MTAEEADDYVTEHGTGTPRTRAQLQSLILADMAEDIDRSRSAARDEEEADILLRRRDALYAGSHALLGVPRADADDPLQPADYLRLRAGRP